MNIIEFGDCRETMRRWKEQGVKAQTCVTSPPYYGLRDYGTAKWEGGDAMCDHAVRVDPKIESSTLSGGKATIGHQREGFKKVCLRCGALRIDAQLGLEETPEAYITAMVEVFRCVWDVLADDGTLWLNIGDSYAAQRGGTHMPAQTVAGGVGGKGDDKAYRGMGDEKRGAAHRNASAIGLKHKDLIGIPWMLAFALRADGWYLRQDIIWHKPNPMPESVQDRCTKAHEYIFLLSKSQKYYFDNEAIAEPLASASIARLSQANLENQKGSDRVPGKTNGNMKAVYCGSDKPYTGKSTKDYGAGGAQDASATKARIVDRILSGEITTRNKRSVWTVTTKPYKGAHFATFPPDLITPCILAGAPAGGVVLDPFMGSGTTASVALQHGRQYLGCELNPEYGQLQQNRIDVYRSLFDAP